MVQNLNNVITLRKQCFKNIRTKAKQQYLIMCNLFGLKNMFGGVELWGLCSSFHAFEDIEK